jgi:hypothetical protein
VSQLPFCDWKLGGTVVATRDVSPEDGNEFRDVINMAIDQE